jgi:hypothetical protein
MPAPVRISGLIQYLALLALAVTPRDGAAQRILRGTVHDSAQAAPLAGAVVTIADSSGATAARTISDASGRFAITIPPRASTLHLIRIGYRPRSLPMEASSSPLELVMSHIPPILDVVRVSDRELCPGSPDRGPAFQYWEQARAGLLAEVVARETNPATATIITYERRERLGDGMVRQQTVNSRSGKTKRPFLAPESAPTFARRGYMVEAGGDRIFSAPDADVLLDESFAATHCFHLQTADAAHTGQIGIAFTPVPDRPDSLVDVAGTLWLDRTNPSLRSFDFRYTNLEPAAARATTGGHIEFRSVANGVSFVERWALRLAILGPGPRAVRSSAVSSTRSSRAGRDDLIAQAIQETGGQVLQAAWLDGTMWRDSSTGIKGVVTQRDDRPLAHALVTLAGTSDTVETDSRGEFVFHSMVPGKYMVEVADTTLFAFTSPRTQSRAVEIMRGKVADFRATLPPVGDVILRMCKDDQPDRLTTVVAGRVSLPKTLAERAEIQASWQADFSGYYGVSVEIKTANRTIAVDDAGRFFICKVAASRPLKLRIAVGGAVADTTIVVPEGPYTIIDWRPWQVPR